MKRPIFKGLASAPKDLILYEKVKLLFQDYNVVSSLKKGGFFHWNQNYTHKILTSRRHMLLAKKNDAHNLTNNILKKWLKTDLITYNINPYLC